MEVFLLWSQRFLNIYQEIKLLEKEPLVNISKKGELVAYKHEGFWQCMDTKRDKELLEKNLKIKKN